jgi:hypothetical protein
MRPDPGGISWVVRVGNIHYSGCYNIDGCWVVHVRAKKDGQSFIFLLVQM